MHRLTTDQALSDFDAVIEAAQSEPVEIVRDGKGVAVVLSPQALRTILSRQPQGPRPDIEKLMQDSMRRFGGVYTALAKWEAENEPPERGGR